MKKLTADGSAARTCHGGEFASMSLEFSGVDEFTEFLPDHFFRDVEGNVLFPVMYGQSVADEFRRDRAGTGPGFDYLLLAAVIQRDDFFEQLGIYVWSFLGTSGHGVVS
jgi:hypothetical protein